jgi:cytidylate kinase
VIVGRAGQVLLAQRRDVLHVRVVAPLKQRITYVARREGLDEASAQVRVQLKDRDRARYLQMQYQRSVDDPLLYDLVVNTGILDLDSAVDLICLALQRKAQRLSVPEKELGPAAGLAPYPSQPADLRPPPGLIET